MLAVYCTNSKFEAQIHAQLEQFATKHTVKVAIKVTLKAFPLSIYEYVLISSEV